MKSSSWQDLVAYQRETGAIEGALAVVQWDQQTYQPAGGADARGAQIAALSKITHSRTTDPRVGDWLAELAASEDRTPIQDACLRNLGRAHRCAVRVPADLVGRMARAQSDGFGAWMEARRTGDYDAFAPALAHVVSLVQEQCGHVDPDRAPYDVCLEMFDPAIDTEAVTAMFDRLTPELQRLLDAIRGAASQPMYREAFDVTAQLDLFRRVTAALGYDPSAGRVDLAEHPFTISMGAGDTRITVRCEDDDLLAGLGGAVHEGGHALYEQGLPWHLAGTTVEQSAGMGLHESQSRFWENFIGRSRPFFEWLATFAGDDLGCHLDAEALYRGANRVVPGLIRVSADEVTYNLHVAIRFELEKALVAGQLSIAELPDAWNARYERLLGVRPPDPVQGVLQDVHWSGGMFGYFPSYSLGNLYAASLGSALQSAMPDLWQRVGAGDFAPIRAWLKDGLHRHGHLKEAPELMRDFVGDQDHVAHLVDYLWARHGALHGVSRSA